MKKGILYIIAAILVVVSISGFSSCKSCNKANDTKVSSDTTTKVTAPQAPLNNINIPHADSSLAPVLGKVMDEIFDASKAKDYNKLASYIVYRGTDMKRMGYDVFNAKNAYERAVVKITADVFNKWNGSSETREYARIFALPQPDGRNMVVMEVIFISKRGVNREFFGYLQVKGEDFKLVDVTSNLSVQ